MNNAYDEYVKELKNQGCEPNRKELQMLGTMILSEKWFNFKQKIKKLFRRG